MCDSEGHLNANSVLLEGTLQHSAGHSVKLDLSQLPAYRLFPGQVRRVGQLLVRPLCLSCQTLAHRQKFPAWLSTHLDDWARWQFAGAVCMQCRWSE